LAEGVLNVYTNKDALQKQFAEFVFELVILGQDGTASSFMS
jgi:hypothetical protein